MDVPSIYTTHKSLGSEFRIPKWLEAYTRVRRVWDLSSENCKGWNVTLQFRESGIRVQNTKEARELHCCSEESGIRVPNNKKNRELQKTVKAGMLQCCSEESGIRVQNIKKDREVHCSSKDSEIRVQNIQEAEDLQCSLEECKI